MPSIKQSPPLEEVAVRLSYGPTTALIVVDVQNDFADPAGSLAVSGGEDAIPFINEQVAAAEEAGALVVYTQDWHPPDTPHFAKDGGIWPVHCVNATWGAELHPSLQVAGPTVRKGSGGEDGYSGFTVRDPDTGATTPTELGELLRSRGIASIVVVGLATDYCVAATACDGVAAGFAAEVLADGIRAVNLQPGDGARAIAAMVAAGVSVS
jgi:nicotinamidase/pyrazinamidase